MRAPIVVAKGVDVIAAKIREIAGENAVPIFEAPPLARVLYRNVDIGEEIPSTAVLGGRAGSELRVPAARREAGRVPAAAEAGRGSPGIGAGRKNRGKVSSAANRMLRC